MKTVSRVLNGEANVRDQTRDRVREAARKLNYRPNFSARSLASKRSFIIAHFHDNPNPDYLAKVQSGMHKSVKEIGYFAVMEPLVAPYKDNAEAYLEKFDVDGLILSPPLSDDMALLDALVEKSVPFVRISPREGRERSSYTCINDREAMRDMTEHMIKQGHRTMAFVAGPGDHGATFTRKTGFLEALKFAGINVENCPILSGDFSVRSGFEAAETFFKTKSHVTAVLCANDDMAVGVIMAALKAGLRIPEDLSVSGFDGSRLGDIIWPTLTTVVQPIEDMAQEATDILLSEITSQSPKVQMKQFEVKLLTRGSTKPLSI